MSVFAYRSVRTDDHRRVVDKWFPRIPSGKGLKVLRLKFRGNAEWLIMQNLPVGKGSNRILVTVPAIDTSGE
jgi:hypothetical protein